MKDISAYELNVKAIIKLGTERDKLQARVEALEREVEYLRHYGNKECTVMADEALKDGEME